uniref:G_PROTEIN_RECEP_F1_2 domain-containing protein n=1 Tax=Haemonchus contortus TaxID=6289 RepID=A0A7I4YGR6_HAECO
MFMNTVSITYQVLYIVVPTISVIGNTFIVYATVLSRKLRNPCNIFIALIALGDIMLMFSFYTTVFTYKIYNDHQIPQDVCVYLHIAPIFGSCFSAMLLLNLAIDRILSLTAFYEVLTTSYVKFYIAAQLLPGCIFAVIVDVLIIINRTAEEKVVCTLAMPLRPPINELYVRTIAIVSILLIICYSVFGLFLKKLQMSTENMKSVYRSLIVISLTIVFGNFGAMAVALTDDLNNPSITPILLAGLLMNFGTTVNFFAYYSLSSQYREVFDNVLGIGRLKKIFQAKKLTSVQQISIRHRDSH